MAQELIGALKVNVAFALADELVEKLEDELVGMFRLDIERLVDDALGVDETGGKLADETDVSYP